MSGIFGIVRRDGYAGTSHNIANAEKALRHRGPDGTIIVSHKAAVLGHHLLNVARNGLFEDDKALIALDGRIDNRAELIARLDVSPAIRDDQLVLVAYRRWGVSYPCHLLGDFAVAIWDKQGERMLCARDQVGVRPLYYHDGPTGFLFASEAGAILAEIPHLGDELDETWMADYMAGYAPSPEACIHPDIRRLPPGHSCQITAGGTVIERYYALELAPPVARADAAGDFARIFEAAVECRLERAHPVAALLSGGLDSTSIVSVAAPILQASRTDPLTTLSMVFSDKPEHDERPYIDAAIALGGIAPIFLESGDVSPFDHFDVQLFQQGGPFIAPNLAVTSRLYPMARERGLRVMLDGHGGDEVIAHGAEWLFDLAYTGHWYRLWREVRDLCAVQQASPIRVFLSLLWTNGPHRLWRYGLAKMWRRWRNTLDEAPLRHLYVNPGLAARTGLDARRTPRPANPAIFGREERESHHANLVSEVQPYILEVLDRAAAASGIELRFPMLDQRLMKFCLSLPSSEKLRHGLTRSIIRRGLSDKLPPAVRLRPGKLDFMPHLLHGLVHHDSALIDDILADKAGTLGVYANLPVLRAAWDDLRTGRMIATHGFDVQAIWRGVALGLWLRHRTDFRQGTQP